MGTFHHPLYTRERDGEMLSWERRRETDPRGKKHRGNGGSRGRGGGARHRPAPSDVPRGAPAPPSSSRGAAVVDLGHRRSAGPHWTLLTSFKCKLKPVR